MNAGSFWTIALGFFLSMPNLSFGAEPIDSINWLVSFGGGASAREKAYALHMRLNTEAVREYETFGYGLGLEYAKASLGESRERNGYRSLGYSYIIRDMTGLRFKLIKRISDDYTASLVFAGGSTHISFDANNFFSMLASADPAFPGFDLGAPYINHSARGAYANLGIHLEREHPSLVRLSAWGINLSYYRAQFPTGTFRQDATSFATAPGLLEVFIINLHLGIGGIIGK
jgi:hypothetical protein